MANPGELVRTLAAALGLPEATLVLHDRNLADAGLRTKVGRGRSAAKVTPRDAAHLITAVLASGLVKESVHAVQRYAMARRGPRRTGDKPFADAGIAGLAALPDDHCFIDAVEAVIASCVDGTLTQIDYDGSDNASQQLPRIEIAAHTPGTLGNVRIAGLKNGTTANVTYVLRDPLEVKSKQGPKASELARWEAQMREQMSAGDFEQYRRISERTVFSVAALLATGKEVQNTRGGQARLLT